MQGEHSFVGQWMGEEAPRLAAVHPCLNKTLLLYSTCVCLHCIGDERVSSQHSLYSPRISFFLDFVDLSVSQILALAVFRWCHIEQPAASGKSTSCFRQAVPSSPALTRPLEAWMHQAVHRTRNIVPT